MTKVNNIPSASYGILQQSIHEDASSDAAEQVRNLGYAILDAGYTAPELKKMSDEFDRTRGQYVETHGEENLRRMHEFHTIRAPLTHGGEDFLRLAFNKNLISTLKRLIEGKFILNQQNGVYSQSAKWCNQSAAGNL